MWELNPWRKCLAGFGAMSVKLAPSDQQVGWENKDAAPMEAAVVTLSKVFPPHPLSREIPLVLCSRRLIIPTQHRAPMAKMEHLGISVTLMPKGDGWHFLSSFLDLWISWPAVWSHVWHFQDCGHEEVTAALEPAGLS
jgi:hypothetical protein